MSGLSCFAVVERVAGFRRVVVVPEPERVQFFLLGPYLVQKNDLYRATLAVKEAVGRFPRSADLALMQGTLLELSARPAAPRWGSVLEPLPRLRWRRARRSCAGAW